MKQSKTEKVFISILISSPELILSISDRVKADMFAFDANKYVYEAVLKVFYARSTVDVALVSEAMTKAGKLMAVGGMQGLVLDYVDLHPGGLKALEAYAAIIIESYKKRELKRIFEQGLLQLDDETKTPDELAQWAAQEIMKIQGDTGKPIKHLGSPDFIQQQREELEAKVKAVAETGTSGIPTGLASLDRIIPIFTPGKFTLLGARPSMGKSALATQFSGELVNQGHPGAFFSLEMIAGQIYTRHISRISGVYGHKLERGENITEYDWGQITNAEDQMEGLPLYVDDTSGLHILDLKAKVLRLIYERDIRWIIIDYLQLMQGIDKGNRDQELGTISRICKEIANDYNIPVLGLVQLSRKVDDSSDKVPLLSHLRESGNLEQDADNVVFLVRFSRYGISTYEDGESTEGMADIYIAKQRGGPVGEVRLGFHSSTMAFSDLKEPDYIDYTEPQTAF